MSAVEGSGVGQANYEERAVPVYYYPYVVPVYSQFSTVSGYYHAALVPTYIPPITNEVTTSSLKPKRPNKSPRSSHRIATPPYTPPGTRAGTNSEKRFEKLQKRSKEILEEIGAVDKRLREMEGMIKRRLYDIVLRQYTGKYQLK